MSDAARYAALVVLLVAARDCPYPDYDFEATAAAFARLFA
jgi:hypothetical protein